MSIDEIKNSIKKLKKDILVSYLGIAFFVLFLFLVILGISILFWMGFLSFIASLIFLFSLNKKFKNLIHQKYDEKRME